MKVDLMGSVRACDAMILSILADQPYFEVTMTQGVSDKRLLIFTLFNELSLTVVFHHSVNGLNFFLNFFL